MDELEPYEAQLLCDNIPWAIHQNMENVRTLAYFIAAPYTKHKKKITEFWPLVTDDMFKADPLKGEALKNAQDMIKQAFNIKK